MVQGKTKGTASPRLPNPRHAQKAAANLKKGRVAIPPKKAPLVKQDKLRKSLSAKINRSVEGQMVAAASSGKLTIMKNTIDPKDAAAIKAGNKSKPTK
ncbi:hypothetical protein BKA70DRAFT_1422106 [Coprinopsis sp. MPI-PUGE-AT-0042]|nr:hypothetical protein BKA70DRAFT_1422106 [Coprinopsis sp. MPI-PUGE-AT-0042]